MRPNPSVPSCVGFAGRSIRRSPPMGVPVRILVATVLGFAAAAACAPALHLGSEVGPEEIPQLEERLLEAPTEVPLLVRLGRAYRSAGRLDEAVETLERAAALDPGEPAVVVHLGLAFEQADRPADARQLYEDHLQVGPSPEMLSWIHGRMVALRRQEFVLAARDAVRREQELTTTPPQPRHVAVLPFRYTGTDPLYEPLSRALADLMVTDLTQTDRITVLERMRVQVLLDEMGLVEQGVVDPSTAARSGRLLGAERTVLGELDASADEIMLAAAVVWVADALREPEPFSERDVLQHLFDAQKRLALDLYQRLGIELTAAERERVLQHRTQNLEALLAFGRGLEEEDRGNFTAAAAHYREAAQLDPGFQEAGTRADEAEVAATTTMEVPSEALDMMAVAAPVEPDVLGQLEGLIPDGLVRDAVSESQGLEGIGQRTILEVLLRRP